MDPKGLKFITLWEEEETVIVRTRDGFFEFNPEWYFCIRSEDATSNRDYLIDLKETKKITRFVKEDTGFVRIYVPYMQRKVLVAAIASMMPTFEADLRLWQRFMIDNELELEVDQKILYFDIETNDLKKGIEPGSEQIFSIAAMDGDGKEYYFYSLTQEKKVLKQFISLLEQHHLLVGWHSEGFDLVAIKRRCALLKIPFDCKISSWSAKDMGGLDSVRKTGKDRARPEKFNHLDLMQKIKEMHYRDTELIKKVRSFSLNAVAKAMIGDQKVDLEGITIHQLAHEFPDKLREYNMQDVALLKKLNDKLNVTKQKLIEHHICGARVNDYTSHGKIDPYALRAAKLFGTHLPSRPDKSAEPVMKYDDEGNLVEDEGDYAGGFVFEPERGHHKEIHVFDFASLYPSIIKTFNVSIDSFKGRTGTQGDILLPTGVYMDGKTLGIIPRIIQSILDSRDQIRHVEMKKVEKNSEEYWNLHYRQYSFKVLANSMYGIMGASFSRYYKRELAEGITLTGQHMIKWVWEWLTKRGHHPIYGDTDSIFIKFGHEEDPEKLALECDADLQEYLVKMFNARRGHLHLNYEATYETFLMISKKKYIGRPAKGDIKMMGMESKKRDVMPKAEEWQRDLITSLLSDKLDLEYYKQWVLDRRALVHSGSLKREEITFQKRLSREIEDYGGLNKRGRPNPIPVHVKVAAKLREANSNSVEKLNLYSAGSYVPYIITSSKHGIEAIYAPDYTEGSYDKEYYWEACYGPSERVLSSVFQGIDWTDLDTPFAPVSESSVRLEQVHSPEGV